MTEPTDSELDIVLSKHWPAFATMGTLPLIWTRAAFREAIAKWGTPPAVAGEPVATVFTMEALAPGGGVKYHATVHEPLPAGTKLYTHPSPPRGMRGGWISVEERLPESDVPVLAHNGKWTGVAAWMSGDYLEPLERWQDEHREFIEMMGPAVTHWTPLPLPPTTSAGSGKGE